MTENVIPEPLLPLEPRERQPETAEVLRRLLEGDRWVNPWLPFPQQSCRFIFGPNRDKPLPVGTLKLLWSAGSPWVQRCPECGGQAYTVDFGAALIAIGGLILVCVGCDREFYQPHGSLLGVRDLLDRSPLVGTRFRYTAMFYGGSRASDGAELRVALGLAKPPAREVTPAAKPTPRRKPVLKPPGGRRRSAEDEVSVSKSTRAERKPRLRTDLGEASRTERQAGKPTPASKGPRGQSVTAARSATAKPKRPIPSAESSCWTKKLMEKGLTREQATMWISNFFM